MTDTPRTRLTCRASNGRFQLAGKPVERGVVSYYAALTLPDAGSLADWAARINEAAQRDRAAGRRRPALDSDASDGKPKPSGSGAASIAISLER